MGDQLKELYKDLVVCGFTWFFLKKNKKR
jgi:hypothetical protein